MTRDDNWNFYIQFSSLLDSIDAGENFVWGGWQFACMKEADQLDIAVGTYDQTLTSFSISPKPCNDQVTISVTEAINSGNIDILDQIGRKVTSISIIQEKNVVDISFLAKGMYFVSITDREGRRISKTQKLVKM